MLKQAIKAVMIIYTYARLEMTFKLLQRFLIAVLTPLAIYFTQRLIDSSVEFINGDAGTGEIFLWGSLLLTASLFKTTEGFFDGILDISLRRKVNLNFTSVFIGKFKKLDYSCFEDKDVQDTIKRMSNEPQEYIKYVSGTTLAAASMLSGIIISTLIFAQVGIGFTIGFIALLYPMLWCDFKAAELMNSLWNKQSTEERRLHYMGGLLSNKASIFELKIFGATDYIIGKWRAKTKVVLDERLKTTIHSQKYFLLGSIFIKIWSFYVVISLVYAVINNNISIGLFTALIASIGTVVTNSQMFAQRIQFLKNRTLLIGHFDKFMAMPEIPQNDKTEKIENPCIVFDNVTFKYPKTEKTVLNNISFTVNPNERVSFVGENGAGKSTVIKLLCRLYKPDSGRILINGTDINELSQSQLRGVYSVVFQDFCNYSFTLRENVAFGDLTKLKNDDAINLALEQGLWNYKNIGLETNLGKLEDDGIDLSGGQWQRIAVARACCADSAFVILDEPAASLDPIAECEMYQTFSQVLKNKGCIMISHRLASAKMADKIIVIENGTATETGSHDELMKRGVLYAKMFLSQSAWYGGHGIN